MFKNLLFGLGLALSCPAMVLAQRNCGTMAHLDQLEHLQPGTKARLQQTDRKIDQARNQPENLKTAGLITIPVVVHVLYRTGTQNISQAQIESQLEVLNEDFSKTNADAVNIPAAFKPLAGDMQIRFELAKRDPNGDPTTGITRTPTSVNSFGTDDAMKYAKRGGHDIWDRDKYLNIWVCNLGGGVLGYAQFPGAGPQESDGVVIGYNYFGRTGVLAANFNKGRTATHEVGHWLGLYHIWGDEPGCSNDDHIADTPLQKGENYGCPTFPQTTGAGGSCAAVSPGSMFMNYMDYVDDACMNMFSAGQVSRARDVLQIERPDILNSDGAIAVVVKPLDASVFKISQVPAISCEKNIHPKITLKNRGATPLTSATIQYHIDHAPPRTYAWSGLLNSFETTEITLPEISVGFGDHTLTVASVAPNGQTDQDPANDAQSFDFTVKEQSPGLDLPFSESFEAPLFPPQGWALTNADAGITWERTRRAASKGFNSAYLNNYDYEYIGQADELEMPALNLNSFTEPKLTFRIAYTATAFGSHKDSLQVLASTDCGVTFNPIYKKGGRSLATIAATVGNPFYPDTSQWRTDTVNLAAFSQHKHVILKFRSVTGYENNLFLDDILVAGKVAAPTPVPAAKDLLLFPNPTSGKVTLQLGNKSNAETAVFVTNSIGQLVAHEKLVPVNGNIKLDLTGKANGIYFIQVISEGKTTTQKIVLTHSSHP